MDKEFDKWNKEKKRLHDSVQRVYAHEREVWWCAVGVNVGSEEDGSGKNFDRPVLLVRAFSRNTFLVVPLTTSPREHRLRPSVGEIGDKQARALLSQVRVVDSKRLIRKVGYVDHKVFKSIRNAVKGIL